MNSTFYCTNLNVISQFTNAYYLLIFQKLCKVSHFPIQNWDSNFTMWIKLIHLCAFKHEFGNLRHFTGAGWP